MIDRPGARPLAAHRGQRPLRGRPLHLRHAADEVLHGIDLDVPAGTTVALVGHTGAGKSTIAKLIARFYEPTHGRITIDGIDLNDVTQESLRRQLGIVPQEGFLFAGTVAENIAFGKPDASTRGDRSAPRARSARDDFILRLEDGYETELGERGSRLSLGQRQLVAFARALLADPGSSSSTRRRRRSTSARSGASSRRSACLLAERTAFVIAHRLSTIRDADPDRRARARPYRRAGLARRAARPAGPLHGALRGLGRADVGVAAPGLRHRDALHDRRVVLEQEVVPRWTGSARRASSARTCGRAHSQLRDRASSGARSSRPPPPGAARSRSAAAARAARARRARAATAARQPASPCRRDAASGARSGTHPGTRRGRTSRSTSRCGSRVEMADLVRDHDLEPRRGVNRPSTSVSQRTTRRLGPIPIASAFGSEVTSRHVLDVDRHVPDVLLRLELRRRSRAAPGSCRRCVESGTAPTKAKRSAEADERGCGGHHQSPTSLRARPITIAERDAEEHELAAEREPAAEQVPRSSRRARRGGAAATRGSSTPNGSSTAQTRAKPSIPSSIPVPTGPAADSRAQRAPQRA